MPQIETPQNRPEKDKDKQALTKETWLSLGAAAALALLKEYIGSKKTTVEAKTETSATAGKLNSKPETAKETAHEKLVTLQQTIDDKDKIPELRADGKPEDKEVLRGTDTLLIGDSMMHGMQGTYGAGERPNFIGHDGFASFKTLERLRRAKMVLDGKEASISDVDDLKQAKVDALRLKGPEKAFIYTGGNNVDYTSPEAIVSHMIEMTEICKSAGVSEIVICTRFPSDPRRKEVLGEGFMVRQEKSSALRQKLLQAYEAGRFPGGVKLVDLYAQFANESGVLKEEYVDYDSKDTLHPHKAFRSALDQIKSALS